jgi:BTB/POZ domain
MHLLKTISYQLTFTTPEGGVISYGREKPFLVNVLKTFRVESNEQGRHFGDKLPFTIKLKLKGGDLVANDSDDYINSSIGRLYNNAELSDVEVRWGCVTIKAHKTILAASSETLRTAFSRNNFLENKTGVYSVDPQHMNLAILQDVIRQGLDFSFNYVRALFFFPKKLPLFLIHILSDPDVRNRIYEYKFCYR